MNSLFPERFSYSDIASLWQRMTDNAPSIDFNRFSIIFEPRKRTKQRPNTAGAQRIISNEMCGQIMFKLRGLVKASKVSLHDVFNHFDYDRGDGMINLHEFSKKLQPTLIPQLI
jgi:hypothetical protein